MGLDWTPTPAEVNVIRKTGVAQYKNMAEDALIGAAAAWAVCRWFPKRVGGRQGLVYAGFVGLGVVGGYVSGGIVMAQELCRTEGGNLAPAMYKELKSQGLSDTEISRRMGVQYSHK